LDKIENSKLTIFPRLSTEAKTCLEIKKYPNARLGSRNGAEEAKKHKFCRDLNWTDIYNKNFYNRSPLLMM
jgi:hypothetical protein